MAKSSLPLAKSQYEMLAALRHALRHFIGFSRDAAVAAGVTPQQHQAMLAIKGFPGRDYVSIGELAERLDIRHHSAVGLVDRLVRRQLVRRTPSSTDRRKLELRLTKPGETLLSRLSTAHLDELRQMRPVLQHLVDTLPKD